MKDPLTAAFENPSVSDFMETASEAMLAVIGPLSNAFSKAAQVFMMPAVIVKDGFREPTQARLDERLNTARYKNRLWAARNAISKGANPNLIETEADLKPVPFWMPGLPCDYQYPERLIARAARDGQIGMMKLLIENGADINAPGETGTTALMEAACAGKRRAVKLLLRNGADITLRDKDGRSALDIARLRDYPRIEALLK